MWNEYRIVPLIPRWFPHWFLIIFSEGNSCNCLGDISFIRFSLWQRKVEHSLGIKWKSLCFCESGFCNTSLVRAKRHSCVGASDKCKMTLKKFFYCGLDLILYWNILKIIFYSTTKNQRMKLNTKNSCANVNQIKPLNHVTSKMTVSPDVHSITVHSTHHPPHQAFAVA